MDASTSVSVEDVLVDMSHDIRNAMQGGVAEDDDTWSPVSADDNAADAYSHGVADGVRWLLEALIVGGQKPNEVPITDEILETLAGVMYLFGERGTMCATLTLKEA